MIGEDGRRHYTRIKDFNTFMYDHTLHRGRKHFCRYFLQAFSREKILKSHIKDCFKINDKQRIVISEKGKYVKFKTYERKLKSPFIIYAGFQDILVPEDNRNQNAEESYINKYQKYIAYSYGHKLVCTDEKFSKNFKANLGKDAGYNFINSMTGERKYCSDVMKKYFNK